MRMVGFSIAICLSFNRVQANEDGLKWLAYHQEADGHWDSKKYGAEKKTDTAVTSLALLAFLGAGHSEKVGGDKDNVRRAVEWLKSRQNASGKVFETTDDAGVENEAYATAMAMLALGESAAMANKPETKTAAQWAVTYCTEVYPLKRGALDAQGQQTFTLDSTVTTPIVGWNVMALKSAKVAGLKVPHGAFDPIIEYLDSVDHKLEKPKGEEIGPSDYWYRKDQRVGNGHPAHRMTAIGCLCRQFLGWKKEDLHSTVAHVVEQSGLPVWNEKTENVDVYYWYIATLCTFQQGNAYFVDALGDNTMWRTWSDAKNKALLDNQRKDGDYAGSWDVKGDAARDWGRVGQTALGCLCMEIYVR